MTHLELSDKQGVVEKISLRPFQWYYFAPKIFTELKDMTIKEQTFQTTNIFDTIIKEQALDLSNDILFAA